MLKDVSFTAAPGQTVVLMGPSGSGKTTIAGILLKYYAPAAGDVYLDGVSFRDIDTRWLRSQISTVSQDIFLFDDTIAANIRYSRPDATQREIEDATRRAGIHEEILGLPGGYGTVVGSRGTKLSVGQRQRISIARAFLKNAPILVFDEPTSALDPGTEETIKESLRKLGDGKTVIIISHHMSLTYVADQVLEVREGKVENAAHYCAAADDAVQPLSGRVASSPERTG